MTDKLISDLSSIGAAIADNTATEVQRNGQTTTEQALGSDWKTYIKSWIAKADVGLGSVSNNAQLTIANNLSDVNDAPTSLINVGGSPIFFKKYVTGRYYTPFGFSEGTSAAVSGANRITFYPFMTPQKVTISELFLRVSGGASGIWQAAIYAADATTLMPTGTVLAKSNVNASTTTGSLQVTSALAANFQLVPGVLYWMAVNVDNTSATFSTISTAGNLLSVASVIGNTTMSNVNIGGGAICVAVYVDTVSVGTWGDMTTPGASATFIVSGNAPPLIGFKVANVP